MRGENDGLVMTILPWGGSGEAAASALVIESVPDIICAGWPAEAAAAMTAAW